MPHQANYVAEITTACLVHNTPRVHDPHYHQKSLADRHRSRVGTFGHTCVSHPPVSVAAVAEGLGPSSRWTKHAVGTPSGNGRFAGAFILVCPQTSVFRCSRARQARRIR